MVVKMNSMGETVATQHQKFAPFFAKIKEFRANLGPYFYQDTQATYKGQYNEGKRDGHGVQIWPDGSIYEGNFPLKNPKEISKMTVSKESDG